MANKINSEPKKGDMVAFPRKGYTHYGIADGKGNVIHFGADKGISNTECTYKKVSIKDVSTSGYHVDNNQDSKKTPQPPEQILKNAEALVEKKAHYDLQNFNCEIAASELRYGKGQGVSTQVMGSMLGKDMHDHLFDLQDQFGTDMGRQRKT